MLPRRLLLTMDPKHAPRKIGLCGRICEYIGVGRCWQEALPQGHQERVCVTRLAKLSLRISSMRDWISFWRHPAPRMSQEALKSVLDQDRIDEAGTHRTYGLLQPLGLAGIDASPRRVLT
jgi:hypothetical protein